MTEPPADLTAVVFRALYTGYDVHTHGALYVVTPKEIPDPPQRFPHHGIYGREPVWRVNGDGRGPYRGRPSPAGQGPLPRH